MSVFIDSKEIGRRIREFRQKAGFSQEKLAEAIDMSFQQIQKYENGISKLNTSKLQIIADALGITVYAFFDGYIDAPYCLSLDEKKLVEAFRSIKNHSKRNALLVLAQNDEH
jgi:transcriptional regulator with XRE-family HTH domain